MKITLEIPDGVYLSRLALGETGSWEASCFIPKTPAHDTVWGQAFKCHTPETAVRRAIYAAIDNRTRAIRVRHEADRRVKAEEQKAQRLEAEKAAKRAAPKVSGLTIPGLTINL